MMLKNLSIGAFFALVLAVSAQGATVSFMVVETGLREETPTIESSRLWENALLGVFFDTGHIVSNTPIQRISERPQKNLPDEARNSMGDALEGGAEYFILAVLDYQNPSRGAFPKPRSISLRLFKTEPCRFIFSQEYTIPDGGRAAADTDEMINAMSAAKVIASHLKE